MLVIRYQGWNKIEVEGGAMSSLHVSVISNSLAHAEYPT